MTIEKLSKASIKNMTWGLVKTFKSFMALFCGWGSTALRLEPL